MAATSLDSRVTSSAMTRRPAPTRRAQPASTLRAAQFFRNTSTGTPYVAPLPASRPAVSTIRHRQGPAAREVVERATRRTYGNVRGSRAGLLYYGCRAPETRLERRKNERRSRHRVTDHGDIVAPVFAPVDSHNMCRTFDAAPRRSGQGSIAASSRGAVGRCSGMPRKGAARSRRRREGKARHTRDHWRSPS